jgi:hypothetical protein
MTGVQRLSVAMTSITKHRMQEGFERWRESVTVTVAVAVHGEDGCDGDRVVGCDKDTAVGTDRNSGVDREKGKDREDINRDVGTERDSGRDKGREDRDRERERERTPLQDMILSTSLNCPYAATTCLLRTCDPRHPHITSEIDYTDERLSERVAAASMVLRDWHSLSHSHSNSLSHSLSSQRGGMNRCDSTEFSITLHENCTMPSTPNPRYEFSNAWANTHTHTHTHTLIHTYTHTHTYIHTQRHTTPPLPTYTHTRTHVDTHTHTTPLHSNAHTRTHPPTHTRTHVTDTMSACVNERLL